MAQGPCCVSSGDLVLIPVLGPKYNPRTLLCVSWEPCFDSGHGSQIWFETLVVRPLRSLFECQSRVPNMGRKLGCGFCGIVVSISVLGPKYGSETLACDLVPDLRYKYVPRTMLCIVEGFQRHRLDNMIHLCSEKTKTNN